MEVLERIKLLCKQHDISIYQLEDELEFGRNTIYQWKKRTPGIDKINAVANYFLTKYNLYISSYIKSSQTVSD